MNTLKLKTKKEQPPSESLVKLNEFLTGDLVSVASVSLSLSGPMRKWADEYFKLREALGVRGYMTPEEALPVIKSALGVK